MKKNKEIIIDKNKIYSADFETTTKEPATIWLWGLLRLSDNTREKVVFGEKGINEFMKTIFNLDKGENIKIYFHNLKYDGSYILNWLLNNKYKQVKAFSKFKNKTFEAIIDSIGTIYCITINHNYRQIKFMCSYRISQSSIENLAKTFNMTVEKENINYNRHNKKCKVTKKEIHYLQNDILVMSTFLNKLYDFFKTTKLTVGSYALNEFNKTNKDYKSYFPNLPYKVDTYLRKAYRGGICYVNPLHQNKLINCKKGAVYDYNSMYPSMLHSLSGNYYPVGKPILFDGDEFKTILKKEKLFVINCFCEYTIKKNHLPCISSRKSLFNKIKWEIKSDGLTELYLTNIDYEMLLENYNVSNFEVISGYYFDKKEKGLIDDYINKWYEKKKTETGSDKIFAKYMLNSLTGKFGQKLDLVGKTPYLEDNVIHWKIETEISKGLYLPLVMFNTAYSRQTLTKAINKNYKNFIYCDTDSIHLIDDTKTKLKIGKNLCEWKKENNILKCKYIRQKCYIDKIENKKYNIKIAGLPDEAKIYKDDDTIFDEYYIGRVFKNAKLIPKQVKGGAILVNADFTIKE